MAPPKLPSVTVPNDNDVVYYTQALDRAVEQGYFDKYQFYSFDLDHNGTVTFVELKQADQYRLITAYNSLTEFGGDTSSGSIFYFRSPAARDIGLTMSLAFTDSPWKDYAHIVSGLGLRPTAPGSNLIENSEICSGPASQCRFQAGD